MKIRKDYTCPLEIAHDVLRGKWKTVILYQLKYRGKSSLVQMEKDIKGISQKMLLEHLNDLRKYGLVDKIEYPGYPLRVEYYLAGNMSDLICTYLDLLQDIGKQLLENMIPAENNKTESQELA